MIVFSGGMYVGENTSHGASVELFAYGEQPRRRAQCSLFVKEACFFDKLITPEDRLKILRGEAI